MSILDSALSVFPIGREYVQLKNYAEGSKPTRSTDESPDASVARNRLTQLESSFDGTYQKPHVQSGSYEDPSGMSDLYERVSAMSMADVNTLHTRWETLRNKLEEGFKTYDAEIAKAISEKWTGNAASSAGKGIQEYVEKSGNLLGSAQMMAEKVKLVESAMQITKDRVKPHEGSTLSGIASYIPGPTWKMDSHNADTAKSEGAEVVRGVYYTAIGQADTNVPLVPQPYNPLDTGSKPVDDKGSQGDTTGAKPTTQQPTTQQPTTEQPTTEQPTTETPTTEDPSDDDTGDDTTPSSTEPHGQRQHHSRPCRPRRQAPPPRRRRRWGPVALRAGARPVRGHPVPAFRERQFRAHREALPPEKLVRAQEVRVPGARAAECRAWAVWALVAARAERATMRRNPGRRTI